MNKEQELKVMVVLSLACLMIFFIFHIKWFSIVCLILLLLAMFGGKPSYIIAKSWMSFAHILGKINTKIIICIAYYLCLTPLAIIYRICNKKEVNNFFNKKDLTYFKDINKKYTKKDLQQLW
ncbi:MAG: SxtJ family membrane protein [Endomicrobiia bacterium]